MRIQGRAPLVGRGSSRFLQCLKGPPGGKTIFAVGIAPTILKNPSLILCYHEYCL